MLLNDYAEFERQEFGVNDHECNPEDEIQVERYQDMLRNPVTTPPSEIALSKQETARDAIFLRPEFVDFPESMIFPTTQMQFAVIVRTAKRARENRQLEVLLKLKQQGNPLFSFLNNDSELYPLYEVNMFPIDWIVAAS